MQGEECFRDGEWQVICCAQTAQPWTVHQLLPTSALGVGKASGPSSNQRFTPTRAITGFQSPKASGLGALLPASQQPPFMVLPSEFSTNLGLHRRGQGRASQAWLSPGAHPATAPLP